MASFPRMVFNAADTAKSLISTIMQRFTAHVAALKRTKLRFLIGNETRLDERPVQASCTIG